VDIRGYAGRTVEDDAKKSMLAILTRVHGEDGSRLGDDPSELDDLADGEEDGADDEEVCVHGTRARRLASIAASLIFRAERRQPLAPSHGSLTLTLTPHGGDVMDERRRTCSQRRRWSA